MSDFDFGDSGDSSSAPTQDSEQSLEFDESTQDALSYEEESEPESVEREQPQKTSSHRGRPPKSSQAAGEDPEIDLGEEKVKLSQLKEERARTREIVRGAYAKFEAAAKLEKEVSAKFEKERQLIGGFKEELSKNGPAAIERLCAMMEADFHDIAVQYLQSIYQQDQDGNWRSARAPMSESEAQLRAEYEKLKQERAQEEQQQYAMQVQQSSEMYEQELAKELEKGGLPVNKQVLLRAIDAELEFINRKFPRPDFAFTTNWVRDALAQEHNFIQSKMSDAEFERYLGEHGLDRAAKIKAQKRQKSSELARPKNHIVMERPSDTRKMVANDFEF